MKKIIIKESQFNNILNEVRIEGYDESVIWKYISKGYIVHGTNQMYDAFDKAKIKGSTRGIYGFGAYFTDTPYKALEYGNEIYLTKKDLYNFLDLDSKDINIPFGELEVELQKAEDGLDNARNNREYDYYESLIDEIKSKINLGFREKEVYSLFNYQLYKGEYRTLENVLKYVLNNLPSDYAESVSSFLIKCGYDGVKCENQYVIFNFDLLNNNLLKDIVD